MQKSIQRILTGAVVLVAMAGPAMSAGLLDGIKSQASESLGGGKASSSASSTGGALGGLGGLGALGLPAIGGSTASNAAGVLQYCIKNKYLGASGAASVKDKLLDKLDLGGAQAQKKDAGYQQGLGGILSGNDGSSFDMAKIKGDLKEKACDYVLENASSLL